jgi:ribonuclease T2
MRNRNPLVLALAALIIAIAGWLGFDLAALQGNAPRTTENSAAPSASKSDPRGEAPVAIPEGDFDSYLLALSWSPSYCETEATERDRLQCGGRPFHFIVHGLWPQNERGYPEDCPTDTPRVPDALVDEMLDIMPSRGLIGHQWRSHGACTGATQEDYFAAVRAAWQKVIIPPRFEQLETVLTISPRDIVQEFVRANPMLKPDQIAVTCSSNALDEVRLCMTKDLQFTSCGAQARRSMCRQEKVRMPPVRFSR